MTIPGTTTTAPHEETERDPLRVGRGEVDAIDADIVRLLARRRAVTDELGHQKMSMGLPVQIPQREAEVVANVRAAAHDAGMNADDAEAVFRLALAQSRAAQHNDRI